jgi:hypothetical protein
VENYKNPSPPEGAPVPAWILALMVLALGLHEVAAFHVQQEALKGIQVSQAWTTVEWLPVFAAFYVLFNGGQFLDPLPKDWEFVFSLFITVFILGLVVGLVHFSTPQHFFGDILKISISWGTLYMTLRSGATLVRRAGHRALDPFLYGLLAISIFDAAQTIYFGTINKGAHIANSMFFIAFAWGLFQETFSAFISLPISALCLKAALLSHKRSNLGNLVAIGSICIAYLVIGRRWKRISGIGFGFLLTGFIMTGSFFAEAQNVFNGNTNTAQKLSTVLDIVRGKSVDSSYQARRNEESNVLDFFDKNPQWWLTGVGFGGTIPAVYLTGNVEPDGTIHHVHPGIYLYLLRFGLIGVFLLFSFFFRILALYKGLSSPYGAWVSVFLILCLGRIVAAFSGNIMVGAVDISILSGIGYVCGLPAPLPVPARPEILRDGKFRRPSRWTGYPPPRKVFRVPTEGA